MAVVGQLHLVLEVLGVTRIGSEGVHVLVAVMEHHPAFDVSCTPRPGSNSFRALFAVVEQFHGLFFLLDATCHVHSFLLVAEELDATRLALEAVVGQLHFVLEVLGVTRIGSEGVHVIVAVMEHHPAFDSFRALFATCHSWHSDSFLRSLA